MKTIILVMALISGFILNGAAFAGNRLYVGGLPFATTSDEVGRLAMGFGTILSVKVSSIDNNGTTSTNAVVRFADEAEAEAAAAALHGLTYMGETLSAQTQTREVVVVGSKVKEVVREAGLHSDDRFVAAVNNKVHGLLNKSIKRAKSNGRGTVRPYDL